MNRPYMFRRLRHSSNPSTMKPSPDPEDLSSLVADLYRWWNQKRGVNERRLLVESFILMEPHWTIRTGSIPFWMVFNKAPSAAALSAYLKFETSPLDEIHMMLFSHGVDSIGLVSIDERRSIIESHSPRGSLIGVDGRAYPRDFAVFVRYYEDLTRKITARYPMPAALSESELEEFPHRADNRYRVEWHQTIG